MHERSAKTDTFTHIGNTHWTIEMNESTHRKTAWMTLGSISLFALIGMSWMLWTAQPASCKRTEQTFVGAHRCKGCHAKAYTKWKSSAHAKAFQLLPANKRNDPACLRCHSTGSSAHLQGVQCESCHGGGKHYIQPEVMVDPLLARTVGLKVIKGAAGCVHCHTSQTTRSKRFDYAKKWAHIAHGKK